MLEFMIPYNVENAKLINTNGGVVRAFLKSKSTTYDGD